MSLRVFHIIFITLCVFFSLFVAAWGFRQGQPVLGGICFVLAVALVVYGVRVFKKLRELSVVVCALLLVAAASAPAWACPVCYGDPGDPMTKGMSNGILTLLGFIGFVQIGFVALFVNFWWRAKQIRLRREQFHLIQGEKV
jgi:hypothetical protein